MLIPLHRNIEHQLSPVWIEVLLTATLLAHLEAGLLAFFREAMVLLLLLHLFRELPGDAVPMALVSLQENPTRKLVPVHRKYE